MTAGMEGDAANFSFGVMEGEGNGKMEDRGKSRAPKRARPADERLDAMMKSSDEDVDKVSLLYFSSHLIGQKFLTFLFL